MPLEIIVLDLFLVLGMIVLISLAVLISLSPILHISFLLIVLFMSAMKSITFLRYGDITRFLLATTLTLVMLYMLYIYKNFLSDNPEHLSFPFKEFSIKNNSN